MQFKAALMKVCKRILPKSVALLGINLQWLMRYSLQLPKRYNPQFSFVFLAVFTMLIVAFPDSAHAQGGIFSGASNALKCIITSASSGSGVNNAILNGLPILLFGSLGIFLVVAFASSVYQAWNSLRQGEEVTQSIIPIVGGAIGVVAILIFQNFIFGDGSC